jgi:hypothetical protein
VTWVLTSGVLQVLALWLGLSAAFFLARSPFGEKTTIAGVESEQFWRGTEECTRRYRAQVNAAVGLAVLAVSIGLQGFSTVVTWESMKPGAQAWLGALCGAAGVHLALLALVRAVMGRKSTALEGEASLAAADHRRRHGPGESDGT